MIPVGIPAASWRALQRAKALGIQVDVKQLAAQWVAVVDGEVSHIDDAPMLVREVIQRREREKAAA